MDDVIILAAMRNGHWSPGIGDPTVLGWVTVVAYIAAAVACGWVWRSDRRAELAGDRAASPTFWLILSVLLSFLGVNKQLDLQSLLTEIGRAFSRKQGWYERRGAVQLAFVAAAGVVALIAAFWFAWIARKNLKRNLTALVGIVLLLAFVSIRASSFHHVDVVINSTLAGVRWNAIMELGGIGLTALGAFVSMRLGAGKTRRRG